MTYKLYRARWVDDNGINCQSLPMPIKMLGNLYDQIQDCIERDTWSEEYVANVTADEWDSIFDQCK